MTYTYVLIVLLHGWSAGIGSHGNAIAMTDFTSKEKCQLAAKAVMAMSESKAKAVCFEK